MEVAPGTVVVWSDIGCPWAHLAVYRLHTARRRLGLEGAVTFEHRPFPLELFNERATPKPNLDAEVPVAGAADSEAGWRVWPQPEWQWPVTMLPALEAVQAARQQSPAAAEQLDRALRVAFFGEGRCISLRHVILEVAGKCDEVDERGFVETLNEGRGRGRVIDSYRRAEVEGDVKGSPHLFLPDGTDAHNPGVKMHWEGEPGEGFPVIDTDDPSVYDDLLRRALG